MAHLDTAFKLGALRAMEVFQEQLDKQSAVDISGATGPPVPTGKTIPAPPRPAPTKREAPKPPPLPGYTPRNI